MPRIDFVLRDRLYILKLICTVQMTYSSFIMLIYFYLITLQDWTSPEDERKDVMKFKWSVVAICVLDFGNGVLLAFAANMRGIRSKRGILAWVISETLLIPISIFLLKELIKKIESSKKRYLTDLHYSRVNMAQICFLLSQYLFMAYALDFIATRKRKIKTYDPNIRPESVEAPTDPQITTTESKHIRLSQSFLFQQSLSKRIRKNGEAEDVKCAKPKDEENEEKEFLETETLK